MAQITISEALGWMKTLKERHSELTSLRNENSFHERRYIGANADKSVEKNPLYDAKKLDTVIGNLAREMRVLDAKIKKTNATVNVVEYDQNEDVLGQLE